MNFVAFLIGVPLVALSLVITVAILKIGWDSIKEKKPPDRESQSKKPDIGGKDA